MNREYSVGDRVHLNDDPEKEVIVTRLSDETADEVIISYTFRKEPIYVADKYDDEKYASQKLAYVVFVESLERKFGEVPGLDVINLLTDENRVKEYAYPRGWLEP